MFQRSTESEKCLPVQGLSPLHMAAHQGHAVIVNQLCRLPRVEVDALDNAGCTPLHHATALGHDGVVMELWSKSANVDLADTNGWTGMRTHTWPFAYIHDRYDSIFMWHHRFCHLWCHAIDNSTQQVYTYRAACSHPCIAPADVYSMGVQSRLQTLPCCFLLGGDRQPLS